MGYWHLIMANSVKQSLVKVRIVYRWCTKYTGENMGDDLYRIENHIIVHYYLPQMFFFSMLSDS